MKNVSSKLRNQLLKARLDVRIAEIALEEAKIKLKLDQDGISINEADTEILVFSVSDEENTLSARLKIQRATLEKVMGMSIKQIENNPLFCNNNIVAMKSTFKKHLD